MLRRGEFLDLTYDTECGIICGELACDIVDEIHIASLHSSWTNAPFFKCHAATTLFSPVVILATLLIRERGLTSTMFAMYQTHFERAVQVIWGLAAEGQIGALVEAQLSQVIRLTQDRLSTSPAEQSLPADDVHVDFDISELFSAELENLAYHSTHNSLHETAASDMSWWETVAGENQLNSDDLVWNSLFLSME